MLRILTLFSLALALASCGPHYVDYFPYHDDGTPKPQVALLPVIDASGCQSAWNIDLELTNCINYEMMDSGELFLLPGEEIQRAIVNIGNADWFESDQALAKQLCDADFLTVIELIQQKTCPSTRPGMSKLNLRARIKVVDLRCRGTRVVLQEITEGEYLVCTQAPLCNEPEPFQATSMGKAHRFFAGMLAKRIENVISSAY